MPSAVGGCLLWRTAILYDGWCAAGGANNWKKDIVVCIFRIKNDSAAVGNLMNNLL
jgi:hypothetical protein